MGRQRDFSRKKVSFLNFQSNNTHHQLMKCRARMENHGTSANRSSHAESSLRLNELTEETEFHNLTTRIGEVPMRTLQNFERGWSCQAWPHRWIKKSSGPRSNPPENTLNAVMRSPRMRACVGAPNIDRGLSLYLRRASS